jgi:hypothetical protein
VRKAHSRRTHKERLRVSVVASRITESSETHDRARLRLQHIRDACGSGASPIMFKLETCPYCSTSRITMKSETGVVAVRLQCLSGKTKKNRRNGAITGRATSHRCRHHRGGGRRHRAPARYLDGHLALSAFTHFTPPAPATVSKGRRPAARSLRMASWRGGRRRGAYRSTEASADFQLKIQSRESDVWGEE